jgi:hypothetical protein
MLAVALAAILAAPPQLAPPPPPPDGSGRIVGGGFGIGLGLTAALAPVIYESTREDGNPEFVAGTFIPLGLASVGVGTYLLVRGVKARRNFLDWESFTGEQGRPSGNGLIVGGTISMVVGGVTLVGASFASREAEAGNPLVPTLWAVGGTAAVAGIAGLAWGLVRRSRYRIWRQRTFIGALSPTIAPTRRGVAIGLAGRF